MNTYSKINNPLTNRLVSVDSSLGKKIIHNYIAMLGGAHPILEDCGYNKETKRCNRKSKNNKDNLCKMGPRGYCRKNKDTKKYLEVERNSIFYDIAEEISPYYNDIGYISDERYLDDELYQPGGEYYNEENYTRIQNNDYDERIKKYITENDIKHGDILFIGSTYETRQEYGFAMVNLYNEKLYHITEAIYSAVGYGSQELAEYLSEETANVIGETGYKDVWKNINFKQCAEKIGNFLEDTFGIEL